MRRCPRAVETHAELAVAYLEMGLLADAREEAIIVMMTGGRRPTAVALDVLFSVPLLRARPVDVLALVLRN